MKLWLLRMIYRLYLRTGHWQRVRRMAFAAYGRACQACGSTRRLQVHHVRYRRGGRSVLWHERMDDLAVLCRGCHKKAHSGGVHAGV